MAGINFHINVDIYFYTNKCVTKITCASSGQHFFPLLALMVLIQKRW